MKSWFLLLAIIIMAGSPALAEEQKCGVNSFSVSAECSGGYQKAYVQCYDGKEFFEGGETSSDGVICKTADEWRLVAEDLCKDRCYSEEYYCTEEYAPVCGSDNITYSNKCYAGRAKVEVSYDGRCIDKACTKEYNPVCGYDGITYGNQCEAEAAGIKISYSGECKANCTVSVSKGGCGVKDCGANSCGQNDVCYKYYDECTSKAEYYCGYDPDCESEGYCGDGFCADNERYCKKTCNDEGECKEYCDSSCDQDCGAREYCGDGKCTEDEKQTYCKGAVGTVGLEDSYCPPCPKDAVCAACPEPTIKICYTACPADCETVERPVCGNGLCEEGEKRHCETYCTAYAEPTATTSVSIGGTATSSTGEISGATAVAVKTEQCFTKCSEGCSQDCGKTSYCGDGVCSDDEQGMACKESEDSSQKYCYPLCGSDCGYNEYPGAPEKCGDGLCFESELDSCKEDCSEIKAIVAVNVKSGCKDSCQYEENCVPIGTRVSLDGKNAYCSIKASFEAQVVDGTDCQNDYECESNTCSSGTCLNIQEELKEQRNILQDIIDFLRSLFGFKT